jgi:hypothetical protein
MLLFLRENTVGKIVMQAPQIPPRTPPENPDDSNPDGRSSEDLQHLWMQSLLVEFPEMSRLPAKATTVAGPDTSTRRREQTLEFKVAWLKAMLSEAEKELAELKEQRQKIENPDSNSTIAINPPPPPRSKP